MLEPIAIDRSEGRKAMRQLLEQGAQRLREGRWVVIFPEGTRVAPGEKRRFQVGGALLAERSGYPVIPVAHNAGEFWSRHSFIKRPGVIQVAIGPVIETKGLSANKINALAEKWIVGAMEGIAARKPVADIPGLPATERD